jgi:site-specific DNA-methyltransferase (adenine-specific)
MINLHLGDCLEAMKEMPDNTYDLAIVDPPYGIGMDGGYIGGEGKNFIGKKVKPKNYKKKDWDKNAPNKEYFDELIRISKNQIVWGANHFISNLPYDSPCWIVWDKENFGKFADCELAWTSFSTAVRQFKFKWAGFLQGYGTANKEERIHPTQKPVRLYEWLLDNYAKEGDKILDTHLGSGSIALACHNRKFDLDAWEIDEEYYNNAVERLDTHKSQLTIFDIGG